MLVVEIVKKKKSHFVNILKTELIELAGVLVMGCKRKEGVKVDSKILDMSHCGG